MRLHRATLKGFRSFRDHVEFKFKQDPGVVLLTGTNVDEPSLGANGAGKTSLWDGVYWILFGRTPSGLKGPEVATWGEKQCVGQLDLGSKTITRTWGNGNNTLTIDGEDASQEQVEAVVGLNAEQFLFSAYSAQHTPSFLDLGAQAKTDLLASVLQLDRWNDVSREAQAKLEVCVADLAEVERDITRNKSAAQTLRDTDYQGLEETWAATRAARIERIKNELADARDLEAKASDVRDVRQDRSDTVEASYTRHVERVDVARQKVRTQENVLTSTEATRDRAQKVLDECQGDKCPTCAQLWPRSRLERAVALRKEVEDLDDAADRVGRELAALRRVRTTLEQELADLELKAKNAREDLRDAKELLRDYAQRISNLSDSLDKQRSEASPYAALERDKRSKLAALSTALVTHEDERALLEGHAECLRYWVKGFKDVRLFLVAEAIDALEVEVNSALTQLGLADWAIKFAPDADTKSGAVKRGFTVHIASTSNPRPVPWTVWSGGEAQRLRLATTMGLSNLIASYLGTSPFVEVWDEPSNGMSKEGISDMLQAFVRRAHAEHRQVWVVDHRALDSGAFIETVCAIKQDGSSRLERIDHGTGE